jgi:hypothetical protein
MLQVNWGFSENGGLIFRIYRVMLALMEYNYLLALNKMDEDFRSLSSLMRVHSFYQIALALVAKEKQNEMCKTKPRRAVLVSSLHLGFVTNE